jgi:hypothetical protein
MQRAATATAVAHPRPAAVRHARPRGLSEIVYPPFLEGIWRTGISELDLASRQRPVQGGNPKQGRALF